MEAEFVSIRRARPLLGTFVDIAVTGAARSEMEAASDAAFRAVTKVHQRMSFHEGTSDVSRLNREASTGAVTVDLWTFQVLETAVDLYRRSSGVFDVTVAPVLQEMGLLPRSQVHLPSSGLGMQAEPYELLPDHRVRFRDSGVRIDLGGIAKGYAVDRAVGILREYGALGGLVNAGGDLAGFGPGPHAVHVRDPRDPRRWLCRIALNNEAIASSGAPLDRSGTVRGSVIDPRTREPARTISGATVRAPSCMLADALTKVAMIAGESAAGVLGQYGASALLVFADGSIRSSRDWQDAACLAA